jgi:hypothetical protein
MHRFSAGFGRGRVSKRAPERGNGFRRRKRSAGSATAL